MILQQIIRVVDSNTGVAQNLCKRQLSVSWLFITRYQLHARTILYAKPNKKKAFILIVVVFELNHIYLRRKETKKAHSYIKLLQKLQCKLLKSSLGNRLDNRHEL